MSVGKLLAHQLHLTVWEGFLRDKFNRQKRFWMEAASVLTMAEPMVTVTVHCRIRGKKDTQKTFFSLPVYTHYVYFVVMLVTYKSGNMLVYRLFLVLGATIN